jgi:hypothetical protein
MEQILHRYKVVLKDKTIFLSILYSFLFLIFSLILNYFACTYATEKASNSVTDLILSNIPVIHVNEVFEQGFLLLVLYITTVLMHQPKRMPFALKSIALFISIRAIFLVLTHIAPFPDQSELAVNYIYSKISFSGDLFFSGHTGLPFLLALIFWDTPWLKWSFLSLSVIFAITVLLGHLHYSIDVFAAYFITYSIYKIAERFFERLDVIE